MLSAATIACASETPGSFESECGYDELQGDKPLTFTMSSPAEATLDGVVCSGSFDAFNRLITQFPDIQTLNIDVIDGSADDEINLKLSKKIHDKDMNTHLNSGGSIASGGVDLFLSGIVRTADDAMPKIGVHSWGSSDGMEGSRIPKSHPLHEEYVSYYRYIDIEPEFYWFTLNAASVEEIHWLTAAEIKKYRVINQANVIVH